MQLGDFTTYQYPVKLLISKLYWSLHANIGPVYTHAGHIYTRVYAQMFGCAYTSLYIQTLITFIFESTCKSWLHLYINLYVNISYTYTLAWSNIGYPYPNPYPSTKSILIKSSPSKEGQVKQVPPDSHPATFSDIIKMIRFISIDLPSSRGRHKQQVSKGHHPATVHT